jgi:tetrapyrrole methylase family protein / MazG family protein
MEAFADLERFERLYAVIIHLRSPGGCAWDREQTPATMRMNLVEEAYEVVDAIEAGDDANLEEEIGDLLLVASSIVRMKEEEGAFGPDDVFRRVCEKLVRRHPHVFGDAVADSSAAVLEQWERIKRGEPGKEHKSSAVDGVPRGLPPLERAKELQHKAAKVGFDWDDAAGILAKLDEERRELVAAMAGSAREEIEEEVGDLLFTVVNLGRKLGVDPSRALASTVRKFEARFREMERRILASGGKLEAMSLAEMDAVWDEVKKR